MQSIDAQSIDSEPDRYLESSKASQLGSAIADRNCAKGQGHAAGTPRSSRYQLRHPVAQTVFLAASTRAVSNCTMAVGVALISLQSPARIRSTNCMM